MSRRRRAAALALIGVLAQFGAACGVSTNDEPQPIPRQNVPSDLIESDANPDDALDDGAGGQIVPVWYLLDDGESIRLHPVERRVPAPAQASLRIDALLDPERAPTDEERQQGISTAIPSDARLMALPTQDGSVLEVSLSNDFYELRGNNFIRAVAQLVFTATEDPDVDSVRFVDEDGNQIAVQDGEGESHDEPVGREDYENLNPLG